MVSWYVKQSYIYLLPTTYEVQSTHSGRYWRIVLVCMNWKIEGTSFISHWEVKTFFSCTAGLSSCLKELRRALGYTNQAIAGRFIPRCKVDGSYENMQCVQDIGGGQRCWCVDSDGKELLGTRVSGKASCVPESGRRIFNELILHKCEEKAWCGWPLLQHSSLQLLRIHGRYRSSKIGTECAT